MAAMGKGESGAERTHSRTLAREMELFNIPTGPGVRALCAAFESVAIAKGKAK
jgi:hypothetical protein